jgi:hypothetical protein
MQRTLLLPGIAVAIDKCGYPIITASAATLVLTRLGKSRKLSPQKMSQRRIDASKDNTIS